jgi:hypothetical protein
MEQIMNRSIPFAEPRFIIAFNDNHPTKYVLKESIVDQYILDMDVYTTEWKTTVKMSEARSYTISDASIVCAVLNKINKCYYRIVPIFEMQTFDSKLNIMPNEL